jgi:hypothetical protein
LARIGTHQLIARGRLILVLAVFALLLYGVGTASASTAQEERQGAEALRELEAGGVSCAELSDEQFEHIGDYAMGRMMGATAGRQMHEVLGRRFSGCCGGALPAGLGRMMGGRYWGETGDGGSDGPSAAAMIGMMAVFIVAVGAAVFWLSRRRPRGPLDTLQRRFAAGELTTEEYEERRRLLGGS